MLLVSEKTRKINSNQILSSGLNQSHPIYERINNSERVTRLGEIQDRVNNSHEEILQGGDLWVEYAEKTWNIGGRPDFLRIGTLTDHLIWEWNKRNPKLKLKVGAKINLNEEGLARCHIASWYDIRTATQDYLNGELDEDKYIDFTDALYGNDALGWKENMTNYRDSVVKSPDEYDVEMLLKELNSAPANLRLDDSSMNSFIAQDTDVKVYFDDGDDEGYMSEQTEGIIEKLPPKARFGTDPSGKGVFTSSHGHGAMSYSDFPVSVEGDDDDM